jgi:hypothetical protein
MATKYLSILKAKAGEFEAVSELRKAHAKLLLPLFEVCRITESISKAVRFKGKALTQAYLDETAERMAAVWKGRKALVDAYQWAPHAMTESNEHVLPYIYGKLSALGVDVVPVLGYDRWGSKAYRLAMQGLDISNDTVCCLRLDSNAISDSAEPDFFEAGVVEILNDMDIDPSRCILLVDFGDTTSTSLEQLVDQATRVLNALKHLKFRAYATAGCSLPSSIDLAVKDRNSTGKVVRKECILWQTLRTEFPTLSWMYGDYGVRGPNTADDIKGANTNGKIRYTTTNSYFIARGHSLQEGKKGAQMHGLAAKVKNSSHYMGEKFSWGDGQIIKCMNEEFRGTPTTWIAIDTNHHISWVMLEVEEFVLQLTAVKH